MLAFKKLLKKLLDSVIQRWYLQRFDFQRFDLQRFNLQRFNLQRFELIINSYFAHDTNLSLSFRRL